MWPFVCRVYSIVDTELKPFSTKGLAKEILFLLQMFWFLFSNWIKNLKSKSVFFFSARLLLKKPLFQKHFF